MSWSDPVPLEEIYKIQDVTGASASEIFITAASASLRDLLIQYSLNIPDTLLTTARYFSQVGEDGLVKNCWGFKNRFDTFPSKDNLSSNHQNIK